MSSTLWIDIETRSRVDLKRFGVYRYVSCPDWKILMASYSLDGSPIVTATSEEEVHDIPGLWSPKVTKVAHNAPFERINFSEFTKRHRNGKGLTDLGFLPPEEYHCTQVVARELGLPASLENAAKALGAAPKDSVGSYLINWFSKPQRDGTFRRPEDHPEKWAEFVAYCEQDVDTLMGIDMLEDELGGWPSETEREAWWADQRINDRGIAIDLDLCRKAVSMADAVTEETKEEFRATTLWEVDNPGSIPQVHAWLESEDQDLPNLRAETVEAALKGDLPDNVRTALELRQELALAAPAKFASALSTQVDGRLRGTLGFFGAHTGRWAGRGTQPHNLPRATFKPEGEDAELIAVMKDLGLNKDEIDAKEQEIIDRMTEDAIRALYRGETNAATLKRLVRPMFTLGTDEIDAGVVVDYSAIEAVVIAWLAGEEWALQAFRDKRDIYVETAMRMGGLTRAQGKIAVLALGYNGGAGSLKAMAGESDYFNPNTGQPVHGGTLGESAEADSPGRQRIADADDSVLYEQFVWPWRDANSNIVNLWHKLDARFRTSGPVGDHMEFEKSNGNKDRLLRLPSGRSITYRRAGIQTKKKWNKHKEKWEDRRVLTFQSAHRFPGRDETYGGRLAENATQAVARDLLAEALIRLERAGLQVVAHVHDEILVQGTRDVDLVKEVMCELPAWAEGLPVDGDGFTTYRYKKG